MTKLISFMIIGAFAIGCGHGSSKKQDTTTTTTNTGGSGSGSGSDATKTTTGDSQPCTQEVALECPDGQIDGCLKQPAEGDTHKCVAK